MDKIFMVASISIVDLISTPTIAATNIRPFSMNLSLKLNNMVFYGQ
ncbi:hypothetical protein [Clostridium sp.]